MKKKCTKLIAALMVLCMMLTVMVVSPTSTYAANGTATLNSTEMTESGSIIVTFSKEATSSEYYNVQIIENNDWDNKLVDTYVKSGTEYEISASNCGVTFSSSNSYQIYIGYWENGYWKSEAFATTTLTVTEDEAVSYELSLSVSDSAPALGDSVTVTASFTVDGTDTDSIPDDCTLSIWYQNDSDWVTPVNGSSSTTSTTISLSSSLFTEGSTYTVQAGLYDSDWNTLASGSVTFTVSETSSSGNYYVTIEITDTDKYVQSDENDEAGSFVYSSDGTVNVKVVLMDGDTDEVVEEFPSGYSVYVWYENETGDACKNDETAEDQKKYDNQLAHVTSTSATINDTTVKYPYEDGETGETVNAPTTITGTISLDDTNFTTGVNYNVFARVNTVENGADKEVDGTMVGTSFTIETTYSMDLTLDTDNYNSETGIYVYKLNDTAKVTATFAKTIEKTLGSSTTSVPEGTMLTIYYQDDKGISGDYWNDLTHNYGSRIFTTSSKTAWGENPTTLSLSSLNFTVGTVYTICAAIYNEGGEMLAYAEAKFTFENEASFYTRTITLDGTIGVNYYVDMSGVASTSAMESYKVVFYWYDSEKETTGTSGNVTSVSYEDSDVISTATFNSGSYRNDLDNNYTKYYRFTVTVDSTQMAKEFTAVLMSDDSTVQQINSGYSVQTYCDKAIKGGWKEQGISEALLNYGGYSQKNFNVDITDLASANISTDYTTYYTSIGDTASSWSDPVDSWKDANVSSYAINVDDTVKDLVTYNEDDSSYFLTTLSLNTKTVVRLYFNTTNTLTFTLDGTTLEIKDTADGDEGYDTYKYYVEYTVKASSLCDTFEISVSDGNSTGTITYCAYAYINDMVVDNDSTTTAAKNVCKALYFLGEAADDYDNWYTGTT